MKTVPGLAILVASLSGLSGCLEDPASNSGNEPPALVSINANPITIAPNATSTIVVAAVDPNRDLLSAEYSASSGSLLEEGGTATFIADSSEGVAWITVTVVDGRGGEVSGKASINIVNNPDTITVATQVLASNTPGVECFLFRGQPIDNYLLQSVQVINPNNETVQAAVASPFLSKGSPFDLQSAGTCYSKHSGVYRFVFSLSNVDGTNPFTFEARYVQP